MEKLREYAIPIRGLGNEIYEYHFTVDESFYQHFENSLLGECSINVKLLLDKRPDMLVLQFDFAGTMKADCDRCLANINLPIAGSEQLIVKYADKVDDEQAEVVFITHNEPSLNVAKYIYEFTSLAVPMTKVYACEKETTPPCDKAMLAYIKSEAEPDNTTNDNNSVWSVLKNLRTDDK